MFLVGLKKFGKSINNKEPHINDSTTRVKTQNIHYSIKNNQ